MASPVAFSWEDDDLRQLQGIAGQLSDMLSTEGKKEREAWDKVHGVLGKYAAYLSIADPGMPTEALLLKLREKRGPSDPKYSDIEALLPQVLKILHRRIGTETADSSRAIQLLKHAIMLVAKELNMLPLCDSIHTEMIQEDTFHEDKVKHLVKWSDELSAPNAPYTVVSIVGAQSSGKSYLLNQLFGTDFPVMNAAEGRKQTTRGILISRCIRPTLLVLDVEGFDGKERGQNTVFEKQAALYALTISDLMMVNISLHDIVREQGGGATLFKTIFLERIKLPPGLTKMLVVIRNNDEETPLDILKGHVMDNLEKMWQSVHLDSKGHVLFKDYIEVKVIALPEKRKKIFRKEVTKLRKLLSESTTDHNRSTRVPASSFTVSCNVLWNEIKQNKRLDLPSHKAMIAKVHCEGIVEEAIKYFDSHKDYELLKSQESPHGFREVTNKLFEIIMARYDIETDLYDATIREMMREKLKDEIKKRLTMCCQRLIRKMREKTSEQFKNEFVTNMKTRGDFVLGEYRDQLLQSYREKFSNLCEDLKVFDIEYLHQISGDLTLELQSYATYQIIRIKEELAKKEVELARRNADKNILELTQKYNEMQREGQRVRDEAARAKAKQENEYKLAKEEMERDHNNLLLKYAKQAETIRQEVQTLRSELEKKQSKNNCSIM